MLIGRCASCDLVFCVLIGRYELYSKQYSKSIVIKLTVIDLLNGSVKGVLGIPLHRITLLLFSYEATRVILARKWNNLFIIQHYGSSYYKTKSLKMDENCVTNSNLF